MDSIDLQRAKIRELSHSSRQTFATCPRKYQLAKLSTGAREDSIHTIYGKAVGTGIQSWFAGRIGNDSWDTSSTGSLDAKSKALLATWLAWDWPSWDSDQKAKKSLGSALFMVEKFIADCESGELPFLGWEFISSELGFRLDLPGEFKYRGYMDLVLRSPEGMPAVIEIKTTGAYASSAEEWQNSEQGTSYSLVLPEIVRDADRYLMLYVVGLTRLRKWIFFDFIKTQQTKEDFVQDLLAETKVIEFYETLGRFPMHGTKCNSFGRACPFFGACHLPTEKLIDISQVRLDAEDTYEHRIDMTNL